MSKALIAANYKQSKVDSCIYFKIDNGNMIFLSIYVDDVLYFTNSIQLKDELTKTLSANFKVKDLGEAKYCLGLRIFKNPTTKVHIGNA